ncbi:FAD:protein FMN transferase [Marinobacteraceae bacterium S3BR75-40.1]
MIRMIFKPATWTALLCAVFLAGCSVSDDSKIWEITGGIFGTQYHIKVVTRDQGKHLEELAQGISETLQTVDMQMSTYKDESELSRFNQAPVGEWVKVSADLVNVVDEAQRLAALSQGAYDVTVGPLVNLWGFGPEGRPEEVPSQGELEAARAEVGYQHLTTRDAPPALKKDRDLYVDLSSIAKGYGVDQVARYLDSQGIESYLVEIGGEVRTAGRKPDGSAWHLGVEKPRSGSYHEAQTVVTLSGQSMATSGDYRNYFEVDGQRFSHTINPKTGRPINHRLASVSVIDDDCMTADGLATLFMVLGEEAGFEFAKSQGIAAYFLYKGEGDAFNAKATPEFERYLGREER